jgi:hypothetical protein
MNTTKLPSVSGWKIYQTLQGKAIVVPSSTTFSVNVFL